MHNLSCYERNRVYLNLPNGKFVEMGWLTGTDDEGDSRGIVAADLDRDGRPDLLLRQVGGGPFKIFMNRLPKRSYLTVRLAGEKANRLGLGARLTAEAGGHVLHREMWASNTFWGQGPAEVMFGLGDAKKVDKLTIVWPSGDKEGTTQVLTDLAVDRVITITEGSSEVASLPKR